MFALAGSHIVYLGSARSQRASILAADPKQQHLGYVPKIKSDAPAV